MTDWGKTHHVEITEALREGRRASTPIYETELGSAYCGDSLKVLKSRPFNDHRGKVQLAFTSPPFPLNTKKSYGNFQGEEYIRWFAKFAPLLRDMVTEDGSIVIEIGNAWMPGDTPLTLSVASTRRRLPRPARGSPSPSGMSLTPRLHRLRPTRRRRSSLPEKRPSPR